MKFEKKYFDILQSTNETALDHPVGAVIVAGSQTAGRGRYGKVWNSPVGNLYMSVVLPDFGDKTPDLAFVVAVSVARALQEFNVQLKWPNDILLNGKKLAGILLERSIDKVIVGIGVNVVSSPKTGMAYQTTDLGGQIKSDELADRILTALSEVLDIFNTKGLCGILNEWKKQAIGIGCPITVNLPNGQLHGIFKDLSESGALMLQLPDTTVTKITAGVVFFDENKGN